MARGDLTDREWTIISLLLLRGRRARPVGDNRHGPRLWITSTCLTYLFNLRAEQSPCL